MSKSIPLTKNLTAIVDDDDYEWLMRYKWTANEKSPGRYYAIRFGKASEGDLARRNLPMHRQILNAKSGQVVDHINGNTLDNRRNNLRLATTSQNNMNRGRQRNNTSGYMGVSWHAPSKKYQCYIKVNRKHIPLGYFHDARMAAITYDLAAKQYRGEFAKTNF